MQTTITASPMGSGHRWQALDVLRGIAVLLVLFRHLALPAPSSHVNQLYHAIYTLQRGGWVGVDLFFVLSGFLVSGILFRQYQREGRIQPGRFLIRRGFKIYPAFWALIFVTVIWIWEKLHRLPLWNVLHELLFVQNYYRGLYVQTWSLGVEEHCYIVLCLLFTILASIGRGSTNPFRIWPWFVVLMSGVVLALRIRTIPPLTESNFVLATGGTHLRCDAFLIGTLVGYWYHFSDGRFLALCQRFQFTWIVLGVACLAPVFFLDLIKDRIVCTWLFTSNAIGGAMLLMGALGARGKPSFVTAPLARIGENSYSIYLWHVLVGNEWLPLVFAKYHVPKNIITWPVGFIMAGILSGVLAAHLIERPMLRLRDRWFPG